MQEKPLFGQTILITGAARRVGKLLALGCAQAGADILIHHAHSPKEAAVTRDEIIAQGQRAWIVTANFTQSDEIEKLISIANQIARLDALVNSAAIFEPLTLQNTTRTDWENHMNINLTAPFLLSQAFAKQMPESQTGRIVNILDWRALRPGADLYGSTGHLPYTISKAALAALTQSLAVELAPHILVNALALGAILPAADGGKLDVSQSVPAGRWAEPEEVQQALVFLLSAPDYITGEIIHVDGGRHLV